MHLYDFVSYCGMLTDKARLDAYTGSLRDSVGPDTIVLDLGAGTGVFSVIACLLGARKVYAVEVNPLIRLVEETAKEKGFADRLVVIQKHSSEIELSEKANLLVSDIHGGLPLHESGLESIIDARNRLLTRDAVMLPEAETVFFALSEAEEIYEKHVSVFLREYEGFSLPAADRLVKNRWFSARSDKERLLTGTAIFAEIDHRVNSDTSFASDLRWEVEKSGTAHGFRAWFESRLPGGHSVSNGISANTSTYASPFFPLSFPVAVKEGDVVNARINAVYEDGGYLWSWQTKIEDPAGLVKAETAQSVIASMIPDSKSALRRSEFFAPALGRQGEIDAFVLSRMDGENLSGDIADEILERFPGEFPTAEKAAERVYALVERYCRG
ncbi:MAG: 50S ribosomal protein L11 methyltransferase [Acidobacteriota bacterium]|nr:MAG: 50S ribosomal protein L11 methyltransferase [Acidobacteriota bacterium]